MGIADLRDLFRDDLHDGPLPGETQVVSPSVRGAEDLDRTQTRGGRFYQPQGASPMAAISGRAKLLSTRFALLCLMFQAAQQELRHPELRIL